MFSKAHEARSMRVEILRLRADPAVWPREQQVVRDQRVERGNIRVELGGPYSRFELDHLVVRCADGRRCHALNVNIVHECWKWLPQKRDGLRRRPRKSSRLSYA